MTVPNTPDESTDESESSQVTVVDEAPDHQKRFHNTLVRLALSKMGVEKINAGITDDKADFKANCPVGSQFNPTVDPTNTHDRVPFAQVVHCRGSLSLAVADQDAWAGWVKRNYPSEVTTSMAFKPAQLAAWISRSGWELGIDTTEGLLEALAEWVVDEAPLDVLTVTETVTKTFMTRMTDLFKKTGQIIGPGGETEVEVLVVKEGESSVSVSLKGAADELWLKYFGNNGPLLPMLEEGK